MWPGQKFALALDEFSETKSILVHQQTNYQQVIVFKSAQYGNVLVLDGVIQLTERDEFSYHEMMCHIPMNSVAGNEPPKQVLIVGGGDGCALREICRYSSVVKVIVVEIDPVVVEVCQTHFPAATACFQDTRVQLIYQDAAEFLATCEPNQFDVIICDTSDPVGPAESLFQPAFYEAMYDALRPNGCFAAQAECYWIHLGLISDLIVCSDEIFDHAEYVTTCVPTYPCGQIGFIVGGKGTSRSCRKPTRQPEFAHELKYYTPAMHRAAFTLPPFVSRQLDGIKANRRRDDDEEEDENDEDEEQACFLSNPPQCTVL